MSGATDRLPAVLHAVSAGVGALVVLTGPAGAGKTHAAAQMTDAARAAGLRTVSASCLGSGAPAFWPWRQVLRSLPPDLQAHRPLARRLVQVAQDETSGRYALFDDVVGLLGAAGDRQATLVVLDDLPEADPDSLQLLCHVAPQLRAMRVIVVATVRTDIGTGRPDWAMAWPRLLRFAQIVEVPPLTSADIADLLTAGAREPADARTVDRVARRTGGNALFVCEVIRYLAHASGDPTGLPGTVRAVIAARLAERPPDVRQVLSVASVLTPPVPLSLLVDLLAVSDEDLLGAVDDAQQHGLLARPDPNAVEFVHAIVRDAVYQELPSAHRAHWHRVAAERLADHAEAADLAYHYRHAGPQCRVEAAGWAERAGQASLALLAYDDAVAHFRAALEASGHPGRVHERLGTALLASGDTAGARAAHLAAARLARADADAVLLARAALGLGAGLAGFEVVIHDRDQVAALEDALALLGDAEPGLRAALLARLSVALTYGADLERRADLAERALALARESGDDGALAAALASYCDVIAGPAHVDERRELSGEIVSLAQRMHDLPLELLGRRQRIVALHERADMGGIDEEIRGYSHTARALRQPLYSWYVPMWRAAMSIAQGRLTQGRAEVEEAQAVANRAGSANAQLLLPAVRWCLYDEESDADAVGALFATVGLDVGAGPWVSVTLALLDAQLGDLDAARTRLTAAADTLMALPRDSEWLPCLAQAAEAAALVGGHPIAAWLYDQLHPFADLYAVEGIGAYNRGSIERHLGLLAASLGNLDAAREHFARALAANERLGALVVARTHYDAGVALGDPQHLRAARAGYLALSVPRRVTAIDKRIGTTNEGAVGSNLFRRDGDVWQLTYAGRQATVRDSAGLRDIARLLAQPARPIAAVDLVSSGRGRPAGRSDADLHEPGDLGELVDARARDAYRTRLVELEEEAAEADARADVGRAERIAAERDALLEQLRAAYGLGGRARRTGSVAERARSTVTARIRASIKHLSSVHPELGRHLQHAIRTGTLCSYEPETEAIWNLTP